MSRPPILPVICTNSERQVIYGSMLGDGGTWWNKHQGGYEAYQEKHCKGQIPYLKWKMKYFTKWRPNTYITGSQLLLRTSCCRFFTDIGNRFYLKDCLGYLLRWEGSRYVRVKILPEGVLDYLGSKKNEGLGLAVWYMDDGYYNTGNKVNYAKPTVEISSHCFSLEENNRIAQWFMERWGIDARVQKKRNYPLKYKYYYFIYIVASDTYNFLSIVEPWVKQVPCMGYKLGE